MSASDYLGTAATVLVVGLVVAMVVGQLLGQPVLLGYVTTDSMEPALSPGDGYIAVPAFVAGEPEEGDVVVFEARNLHGGGLTAHRIVGETEGGYVTKGDANPFTDQDGDEPPVAEGQIVAHVVQVGGEPVAIPGLGTAVETVQSTIAAPFESVGTEQAGSTMVFVGIALFVLAGLFGGDQTRDTERRRGRESVVPARGIVLFAVVLVVGAATASMLLPAGVQEFGLASSPNPTEEPNVVAPGETAEITYTIDNGGVVPALVVVEPASRGVAVDTEKSVLDGGEQRSLTVTAVAPDQPGTYLRHIRVSRYPLVLPAGVVGALHDVHPLLAVLAIDLVVAVFVAAAGFAVFGTGQLRLRSGPTHVPAKTRLVRRLRRWR